MRANALRAITGFIAAIAVLEILFRILPVSTATLTGYHFDRDLLTYPASHEWRVATGWDLRNPQAMKSNNYGFVADVDFTPDPSAVALIGDSYVEASMLDGRDRPGAQLQRLVPDRRVYAMGGPGSSLLDYGIRLRWAAERLRVRDFVLLLEAHDARQSLCGSGNVHSRCLDPGTLQLREDRLPAPSLVKQVMRRSALAQYLASQVHLKPAALLAAMFSREPPDPAPAIGSGVDPRLVTSDVEKMKRRVDAVVRQFLALAMPHVTGRLVVIVDGRRTGPPSVYDLNDLERAHLMHLLRQGGADVIDLEPIFAEHVRGSAWSLEVGPYDGHMNRIGVSLAMSAAAGRFVAGGVR